ncbi:hypothetical protein LguiB_003099 [Lonicera macranthoides]
MLVPPLEAHQMVEVVRVNGGVIIQEAGTIVNGSVALAFDLGLKLLVEYHSPEENLAMMGYGLGPGPNSDPRELYQTPLLVFAHKDAATNYTKGNGYSRIVISTNDMFKSAEAVKLVIKELGGKIIPLPRKNAHRTSFIDPEGWKTALVEE